MPVGTTDGSDWMLGSAVPVGAADGSGWMTESAVPGGAAGGCRGRGGAIGALLLSSPKPDHEQVGSATGEETSCR